MHEGDPKARSIVNGPVPKYVKQEHDSEWQADFFSDCFLMPRKMAEFHSDPFALAEAAMVPVQEATRRLHWVRMNSAKVLPKSIRNHIEALRNAAAFDNESAESIRHDLWEYCDELPGHDPKEWRCLGGRWSICWGKYNQQVAGGWRVSNKKIIAWDDECSR
jgi:hypothetical protein